VPKWRFDFAFIAFINCVMFLRKKLYRKADGTSLWHWQLVESYRTERGSRQRVVAHLGEIEETDRLGIKQAAEGHSHNQFSLFEDSQPSWVEVNINGVHLERTRRFGDVWLALELMKKLGLTDFFHKTFSNTRAKIPWADLASILIVARFCDVRSELSIAEHFYSSSCLPDLL
jgi:hypothetical protein